VFDSRPVQDSSFASRLRVSSVAGGSFAREEWSSLVFLLPAKAGGGTVVVLWSSGETLNDMVSTARRSVFSPTPCNQSPGCSLPFTAELPLCYILLRLQSSFFLLPLPCNTAFQTGGCTHQAFRAMRHSSTCCHPTVSRGTARSSHTARSANQSLTRWDGRSSSCVYCDAMEPGLLGLRCIHVV
jgi:hypothetical protein